MTLYDVTFPPWPGKSISDRFNRWNIDLINLIETTSKFLIVFVRLILDKILNKVVRVQIEILAAIFDWISKQQLNLSLFL